MPIAVKQDTILEETQLLDEKRLPALPQLELELFKEIKDLIAKRKSLQEEEREDRRKVEKLSKHIEDAEEMIAKAEKKLDILKKQNEHFRSTLDNMNDRVAKALEYWKNYGLDVRQVSEDSEEDSKHYEFIFTKLQTKSNRQSQESPVTNDPQKLMVAEEPKYVIGLKHLIKERRLEIVTQSPEVMSADDLSDLNLKINSNCFNVEGAVDYKSAMTLIRKDIIRHLS